MAIRPMTESVESMAIAPRTRDGAPDRGGLA